MKVLVGVAVAGAAFAGATAVMAKSDHHQEVHGPAAGLKPHPAFDRGWDGGGRRDDRPRFEVSLDRAASANALDGRVYVIASAGASTEPRDQIYVPDGTPFWGMDVYCLRPGRSVTVAGADRDVFGYPLR